MAEPSEDAPTFIATPKGDELVVLTRAHYDRLIHAASSDASSTEDEVDAEIARDSLAEWAATGKPSAPLAVVRRVRAGDSWLKAFRSYRGITQTDLARRAGIGQGYLSEIETSQKAPSPDARAALAEALDIHPLFLSDDAPAVAAEGNAS